MCHFIFDIFSQVRSFSRKIGCSRVCINIETSLKDWRRACGFVTGVRGRRGWTGVTVKHGSGLGGRRH